MSAFPYVAIYNTQGKLHGTIGGYYPLETMREAFNTIETWQTAELQTEPHLDVTIQDFNEKTETKVSSTPTKQT